MTARRIAAWLALLLASAGAASAQPAASYRDVAKWAVAYDDLHLGRVEGFAYCDWHNVECVVRLRNPQSKEIMSLRTRGAGDFKFPQKAGDPLRLTLHGTSVSGQRVLEPTKPGRIVAGDSGDKATIKIKAAGSTVDIPVPVLAAAKADREVVRLELQPRLDGALLGRWTHLVSPITERGGDGQGRVGALKMLRDRDIPDLRGDDDGTAGFLGQQSGGEYWRPLLPEIYGIYLLEEQEAKDADGHFPLYRRPLHSVNPIAAKRESVNTRTLVIVGRDLPVDGNRAVVRPDGPDKGVSYALLAAAGTDEVSDEQKTQFERAWKALTRHMEEKDAVEYRKLEAVMLRVTLDSDADAGLKVLQWAGASVRWNLQYGDNYATVRILRTPDGKGGEEPGTLFTPERIVIEVETFENIDAATIPLRLGSRAATGRNPAIVPIGSGMVASKVTAHVFRTAPIDLVDVSTGATPANGLKLTPGTLLFVDVDRDKTHFIRSEMAARPVERRAAEHSPIFIAALKRAAACSSRQVEDPIALSGQTAEDFSKWSYGTAITFGDHAAMLLLRDTFVERMKGEIERIDTVRQSHPFLIGDDEPLVLAWLESVYDPVMRVPGYPLASVSVTGPKGGKTDFSNVFVGSFIDAHFQPRTTVDGAAKSRQWRQGAAVEAMTEFQKALQRSSDKAAAIVDCDRLALLALTSSGFEGLIGQVRLDLVRPNPRSGLTEGDPVARNYVDHLDSLAIVVKEVTEVSRTIDKDIVLLASAVVALPAAWAGPATSALSNLFFGLILAGQESVAEFTNTYAEHAEVEFAYGATAALGAERFFEAESRLTPWWVTGVDIFTQAALQAVGAKFSLAPLTEGEAAFLGLQTFRNVSRQSLGEIRALPDQVRRDLAIYMLKARQQIARTGIVAHRSQLAARVFAELAEEAVGAPVARETQQIVADIQADTLAMGDPFKTAIEAAPDALGPAKRELAEAGLADETALQRTPAELAEEEAGTAATAPAPADAPTAGTAAVPSVPYPIHYNQMPVPGSDWTVVVGNRNVVINLGDVVGEGAFFTVYRLRSKIAGLELNRELAALDPEELVIKILNKPTEKLEQFAAQVRGVDKNVVARMVKGRDLLAANDIRQLSFQAFENEKFIIQRRIDPALGKVRLIPKNAVLRTFNDDPSLRRAVTVLFKKLIDKKIVWMDCHPGNIFFEQVDGEWVAGILDQDFIVPFAEAENGVEGRYLASWKANKFPASMTVFPSGNVGSNVGYLDQGFMTPSSSMQKWMEMKGWLAFDPSRGVYASRGVFPGIRIGDVPGILRPEEVKQIIPDLAHVEQLAPK